MLKQTSRPYFVLKNTTSAAQTVRVVPAAAQSRILKKNKREAQSRLQLGSTTQHDVVVVAAAAAVAAAADESARGRRRTTRTRTRTRTREP